MTPEGLIDYLSEVQAAGVEFRVQRRVADGRNRFDLLLPSEWLTDEISQQWQDFNFAARVWTILVHERGVPVAKEVLQ